MAELPELIAARRQKLERLKARGVPPYPYGFAMTHRLREAHAAFAGIGEEKTSEEVALCGRIVAWRDHGKSAFAHLEDGTGRFQAYFRKDTLGDEVFGGLRDLDVGDFAGVCGRVFRTRT